MKNLTMLGCGTLGRAIVGGLLVGDEASSWRITATARSKKTVHRLEQELHISATRDNVSGCGDADVVILGVKPQMAKDVLTAPGLPEALDGKLLISLCAGVTIAQLSEWVPGARVIRAMPNTPALIREGMTVLAPGATVSEEDVAVAQSIFASVGRCRVLQEKHLDVVTGLSGSGPAFAFVILESLADGGVMMGLPRDVAIELAAQTLQGAARLVLDTGDHPAALRDRVTTPAGCTIAGLFMMEEGRIRSTLAKTVQEAAKVAASLGEDPKKSR